MPDLTGVVESQFLWRVLTGEQVVPFRVLDADLFVLPVTPGGELLPADGQKIDAYPGLADWSRRAEAVWRTNPKSKMSLAERYDFRRGLTQQLPAAGLRVVYATSGMHLAAGMVSDPRVLIDTKLYWAAVSSEAEGRYLEGVLNSPIVTTLVRPLMSYGKDERDIHKHVWKLPIPTYDQGSDLHLEISQLAGALATEVAELTFRSNNFVSIRKDLRVHVAASQAGQRLDGAVRELLATDVDDPPALVIVDQATTDVPWLIPTSIAPLHLDRVEVEADVDCEFDRTGRVYMWGVLLTDASGSTYRAFGSPAEDLDEVAVAREVVAWLTERLGAAGRWFHYGATEQRHLERLLGSDANALLAKGTDLLGEIVRPNFYAPGGYGLKKLAAKVGAEWRTPQATGADTYAWIAAARGGDGDAWDQLVEYNEDDTRATHLLRVTLRA